MRRLAAAAVAVALVVVPATAATASPRGSHAHCAACKWGTVRHAAQHHASHWGWLSL